MFKSLNIAPKPRVALVHDYLNQFGGAERVLQVLSEMFPEAPIYTLFADPKILNKHFPGKDVRTSFLDNRVVWKNHRKFIPIMPFAAASIDLGNNYDIIITNAASFARGVRYSSGRHISYVNAMMRYAWEPETHLPNFFPAMAMPFVRPIAEALREWDISTTEKADLMLTNSTFMARKIAENYFRRAEVVSPPVDQNIFYLDESVRKHNYYLAFGRIITYKRFDLIVEAFNILKKPLLIVGDGPEARSVMEKIRSKHIRWVRRVGDAHLRGLINGAKAVIFPQEEEFGLVAAETVSCGTPLVSYSRGGSEDIVKDGLNGVTFDEQSPEAIADAVRAIETMYFDRRAIAENAKKFSKENFQNKFMSAVSKVVR